MSVSDRSTGKAELAWRVLSFIRIANGMFALFTPSWLARQLDVDPEQQPAMLYVFRMFGIRTVIIGADLWLNPEGRARALRQGVVIHGSDTMAATIAFVFGQLPARAGLTAMAISIVNTALAAYASSHYANDD